MTLHICRTNICKVTFLIPSLNVSKSASINLSFNSDTGIFSKTPQDKARRNLEFCFKQKSNKFPLLYKAKNLPCSSVLQRLYALVS